MLLDFSPTSTSVLTPHDPRYSHAIFALENLSSIAVGPEDAGQLIDLLPGADDFSPVEVVSSSSPDRLEAAVGLRRLHHGRQGSAPPHASGTVPPTCGTCSQAFPPLRSLLGDVSDVDLQRSTIVDDLRQTLRRMNHQAQQRQVDLVQLVDTLLMPPSPTEMLSCPLTKRTR